MSFVLASAGTDPGNIINSVIAGAAVVALLISIKTLRDSQEMAKTARDQIASTAKLADSAVAQLEQQKQALAASIQPAVADVGQDLLRLATRGPALDPARDILARKPVAADGQKTILITVPVRNVGPGPAFIHSTRI